MLGVYDDLSSFTVPLFDMLSPGQGAESCLSQTQCLSETSEHAYI